MSITLQAIKQQNLAEFLTRHYQLTFKREGDAYVCCSPFQDEQRPSFYVRREDDGHWLFKDFAANLQGSVIDFLLAYEKLPDFTHAFRRAQELFGDQVAAPEEPEKRSRRSVGELYELFRDNDPAECVAYLSSRGIEPALTTELVANGTLTLNQYAGSSWCCFALRDENGSLRGLFNRNCSGSDKFVLGERYGFCLDFRLVATAREICLCEGIIDALSLRILLGPDTPVVALLGAHISDELAGLLGDDAALLAAFDADDAGDRAYAALQQRFPNRSLRRFELEGCGDPNELLQSRATSSGSSRRRLTDAEKAAIAFAPGSSRAVAQKYGIHHSRVCSLRSEAREAALANWHNQRPGPQPADSPHEGPATCDSLAAVERERDFLAMRRDYLEMRLRWALDDEDTAPPPSQKKRKKKHRDVHRRKGKSS